jgi:predicted transcriptional regulator
MSSVPVSFRVAPELVSQLSELSEATDRPRSWHLEQALRSYLDVQLWHIRHVRQAMREVRAGRTIPHEELKASMQRWIKGYKKRKSARR